MKINKYFYYEVEEKKFYVNNKVSEIIYRKKEIICSYSGIDQWANDTVTGMIDLYCGGVWYNYTLNSCDHKQSFIDLDVETCENFVKKVFLPDGENYKLFGKNINIVLECIIENMPKLSE